MRYYLLVFILFTILSLVLILYATLTNFSAKYLYIFGKSRRNKKIKVHFHKRKSKHHKKIKKKCKNKCSTNICNDYEEKLKNFENCQKCRHEFGLLGGTAVSHIKGNLVDLENDLRGQTRLLSHCPDKNYKPKCSWCRNCDEGLPCGCIDCQDELINLQTKNMFHYNDVAMPDKIPSYKCPQPYSL